MCSVEHVFPNKLTAAPTTAFFYYAKELIKLSFEPALSTKMEMKTNTDSQLYINTLYIG